MSLQQRHHQSLEYLQVWGEDMITSQISCRRKEWVWAGEEEQRMWGWLCNQACLGPRNGTLFMGCVCLMADPIALGSASLLYAGWTEIPEKGSVSRK